MAGGKLIVAYWAIRGLGAPLRMMCEYANASYEPVLYQVSKKDGVWDKSSWFNVKPELQQQNALMNLPYIVDGDTVVAQSNACLSYLGRKFKLHGENDQELLKVEQCLCEVSDLRNNCVRQFYLPPEVFNANLDEFLSATLPNSLAKLNCWLEQNGTTFLASNDATTPDFHFFELLDQLESLTSRYSKESTLRDFSCLRTYYKEFASLPAVQKYLQSDLHKLPINNPHASFQ